MIQNSLHNSEKKQAPLEGSHPDLRLCSALYEEKGGRGECSGKGEPAKGGRRGEEGHGTNGNKA